MRAPILNEMSTPPAMRAPCRRLLSLLDGGRAGRRRGAPPSRSPRTRAPPNPASTCPGRKPSRAAGSPSSARTGCGCSCHGRSSSPRAASTRRTGSPPTNRPSTPIRPARSSCSTWSTARQWETGSPDPRTPPLNPYDYATMLANVAQRFGSRVAAYEIWNEEDESRWWLGAPDPAAYTQLLKVVYPIVKAAEPHATIVMGGLTGNDYPFLEGIYGAGGKGYFDAVGVHTDTACNVLSPYEYLRGADNRMIPDSFLAYREVHAVMAANGDAEADLDDRAQLAHDEQGLLGGDVGRAEGRRGHRRAAGHLPAPGLPLHGRGPLRAGRAVVPAPGQRRHHLRADPRQRQQEALLRRDARPRARRRHPEGSVRGVHRPLDRRQLAAQPHRLQRAAPDQGLGEQPGGRVQDPPRSRRTPDPQLRRQNVPALAHRAAGLDGRQAHRLRAPHADVQRV